MGTITAVTFDFWNTLCYEPPGHLRGRRLDAWGGVLEEAGFAVEREELDAVFEASWQRYVASWEAGEQFLAVAAAEEIVESLGFDIPKGVRAALVDAFETAGDDADIRPTAGIGDALRTLKDAGVRVGIICDVGMTPSAALRRHLDRHGLLSLFDHWSFSDEVGHYKPAREIFEHALDGLGGVAPSSAAHVGDLRRTDIAGARAMGMTAVRYTGIFDDDSQPEPEGDHVVDHHARLTDVLPIE